MNSVIDFALGIICYWLAFISARLVKFYNENHNRLKMNTLEADITTKNDSCVSIGNITQINFEDGKTVFLFENDSKTSIESSELKSITICAEYIRGE